VLPQQLAAPRRTAPVIDGDLADWKLEPAVRIAHGDQVTAGAIGWTGPEDASLELQVAYDSNALYLAGVVHDDVHRGQRIGPPAAVGDTIEVFLAAVGDEEPGALRAEDLELSLAPLSQTRPWIALDPKLGVPRQGGSSLTGFQVAGRDRGQGTYQFEAAIPFHQLANVRPGQHSFGFGIALVDVDGDGGDVTRLSWTGHDPLEGAPLARLQLLGEGALVSELPAQLLTKELLADLQYLIVPLLAVVVLLVLLRLWPRLQGRARWLRPALSIAGVVLFVGGLCLPSLRLGMRDAAMREELGAAFAAVRGMVERVEQGTLASYRGASRDRALMELLAGKRIARQKNTIYRFLSQYPGAEFGAPVRDFPDEPFPVRPYWLPLEQNRAETFQFDPPLRGEELYVVVGRPYASAALPLTPQPWPQIELELNQGTDAAATETLTFDTGFVDGQGLGRDFHEVDWRRVALSKPLRTLGVRLARGADVRLVGLSLARTRDEAVEPLFLGTASLDGVLTDLRGPYPIDAGIELGPGATRRIAIPAGVEPCQKLWLFYRAIYPGVPAANPGATVAEVVLHFRGGAPPRTLQLEHQVSVFYELVVHNTRDQPPEGSPAAIAFAWVDEQQERHINTVLPISDLPAGAELEAIEFRNLADYRMRFRSVVFGSEKPTQPEPEGSPLIRDGQDMLMRDDARAALAGTTIAIYRDGRLSEATLPPEGRQEFTLLPRDATRHADAEDPLLSSTVAGVRRASVYTALTGDGWDGAVLSVAVTDPDRAAASTTDSRIGLLLVLCGVPLLLVLLSELLAVVGNLRVRLMTVLSVAALAPLVVLSIVLAQVLERGHEQDQEEGMRRQVQGAIGQLQDQMQRLRGSAQQWQQDLAQLYAQRLGKVADGKLGEHVAAVLPALQQLMAGQLPPEWQGGFLRLDWNPTPGGPVAEAVSTVAGDARLASTEAPARLEPGVYVHWGSVDIAVRSESAVLGGTLALTVARPLGADFLGALAPGGSVMLCDPRGYPLEVAGTRIDPRLLLAHGRDAAVMAQRERALFQALERQQPVVDRAASGYGEWLCGCTVLRDLQDTPRALLVVAQPDLPATLDLSIGRIPVRAFFLLVAGLLLVLSAFLSFVVSRRISEPIERLERGAQSLARGELETRVPATERGQLGRLSRTFNQMAGDLQGRLFDLQKLNRAMRELSAQLDSNHTLAVLRRFCEQHVACDLVRIALLDPESGQVDLFGSGEPERCDAAELTFLRSAVGAFSCAGSGAAPPALAQRFTGIRSMVGVPLLAGGRCRGAVLLGFASARPRPVDLDLLATVVAQAAVALDNAQLYRHAVQDPVTGAFAPDYFRRRVAEEVALAQQRSQSLALLALGLGDGSGRPRGLRRFAAVLREHLPRGGFLCHAGSGQFQMLAPGLSRDAAEALVLRILEAWQRVVDHAPESDIEDKRPTTALAVYPEEAASGEFLFEVLRDRLASGSALSPAAVEVDASLQRAGITAVSPAMREVYRTLRRVAPTDLAVLFLGETGSGKEVLTNLLHRWSRRSAGPLVKVHCAALSETLLASELFGHEKGAFTGADRRKIGKFEQASGGTIFLDEVGEIPLDVQVKLLRVLQEREVDRVGGLDPVAVDVRVVAATNRDLQRMVAVGRFREDLYYRLQGIVVNVPPLRERRPEIPALVEQFRSEVAASGESRARAFTTDAMDELFRRDWPGNIRELRNAVYRAMVLAAGDSVERREVIAALPPVAAAAGAQPSAGQGPLAAPSPAVTAPPSVPPPSVQPGPAPQPATPNPEVAAPAPLVPEPTYVLPRRTDALPPAEPAAPPPVPAAGAAAMPGAGPTPAREVVLQSLPPRVRALYNRLVIAGSIGTLDHMSSAGVSHRTGLRDLQLLVEVGLVERVGVRRGARYRPRN